MESGIYAIMNTVNGKQYVGSAVNIAARWRAHRSGLQRGYHRNPHLQAAWNKYGADAFTFTVLEYCPLDSLISREQYWLDTLDTVAHGYNILAIAHSPRG